MAVIISLSLPPFYGKSAIRQNFAARILFRYTEPMDENPTTHPGVPDDVYHTLGKKTFAIFLFQRIGPSFVLLLISIALFALQGQSFLGQISIPNISYYVHLGALAALGLFVLFFLIAFLISWLIYSNYKFSLGDNSLKIKRGIFEKEEVAIPYRQIQDVDIDRDLSFQMLGLSRIVILTAGHEDSPSDPESARGESEGILPALDRDLAEWLQAELLKRTDIQRVVEEPAPSPNNSGNNNIQK
jgi:uncharacterized membrane protein YdbT with pleckstrin-like domain